MAVKAKLSLREGEGHGCNSVTLIDVMQVLLLPGRVMKVTGHTHTHTHTRSLTLSLIHSLTHSLTTTTGHTPSPGDPSLSIIVLTEEVCACVSE